MKEFAALKKVSEKKQFLRELNGKRVRITAHKKTVEGDFLGLNPENNLVYLKTKVSKKPAGILDLTSTFEVKEITNVTLVEVKKMVRPAFVRVLRFLDSGEARCQVTLRGKVMFVKFPKKIVKQFDLKIGQALIWHPRHNKIMAQDIEVNSEPRLEEAIKAYQEAYKYLK